MAAIMAAIFVIFIVISSQHNSQMKGCVVMARKGENIIKRKDGRWEARVIYSRDINGKAKYRYLYGKTYSEAKEKKEFLQSQIIFCMHKVEKNRLTVNDLANEFLLHKEPMVKASTMAHYKNIIDRHIRIHLGKTKLLHINIELIDSYTQNLLLNGKKSGNGLSPKTVHDILSILKSMFKYAVLQNYMNSDTLNFSMPRITSKAIVVLDIKEQEKLEDFSLRANDNYRLGIYLCLYTGLRIGELCSLKWSDIDFDKSLLCVNRTIQRISANAEPKTKIIITEPKTNASVRTIPIPKFLLQILIEKKPLSTDEDIYFLTGTKKYIEPSNYYAKYKRWLRKLNIPSYTFHTLRHTFATRCIEKGFDAKSLSEILGHSNVNITLNRYVHPSMNLKRLHMEKLTPDISKSK